MHNPNCDGGHCKKSTGQVRVLPTGGSSNAILCHDCYRNEIAYRIERNRDLSDRNKFDLPNWLSLKIYS